MNSPQTGTFAWDASALHHAIAADRADVLIDLARPAGPLRGMSRPLL